MLSLGGRLREVAVYENLDHIIVILGQSFASLAYAYCRGLAHALTVSIVGKVNFVKKSGTSGGVICSLVLPRSAMMLQHLGRVFTSCFPGRLASDNHKSRDKSYLS